MDNPTVSVGVRQVSFAPSNQTKRFNQYHRTFAGPTGLITVWNDRKIPDGALVPLMNAVTVLFADQPRPVSVEISIGG